MQARRGEASSMKDSGAPEPGDLVVALYDEERDIACTGLVVECRGIECRILWGSESSPLGWWPRISLRIVHEAR